MQELLRRMMFAFILFGMLLSVSVAVKCTVPRYRAWRENRSERDSLQTQVEGIRQQITATKRNIDRFRTSPYFVEQLARVNHRVADNEIVFIFE